MKWAPTHQFRRNITNYYDATCGFTLLELVIVLLILSLVSLLAARGLHNAQDQHRAAASTRQLEAIRDAIFPPPGSATAPASPALPGGFVSDLGRLPRAMPATNADSCVLYTLSELLVRPPDVPPFALVQLTAAATCPASPAPYDPALDASISVPAGWRGPYLPLPAASATPAPLLRDAWGCPLASSPLDPYGLTNRLSADGTFADPRPLAPVACIRHLGADQAPAGTPMAVSNAFHGDVVLDLRAATNATALATYDVPTNAISASVTFRLYLPCPCPNETGTPHIHILTATVPCEPGILATAAFAPVPAGWHPVAAMPDEDPIFRRTFWTLAR